VSARRKILARKPAREQFSGREASQIGGRKIAFGDVAPKVQSVRLYGLGIDIIGMQNPERECVIRFAKVSEAAQEREI
jgi:hypothetical protein